MLLHTSLKLDNEEQFLNSSQKVKYPAIYLAIRTFWCTSCNSTFPVPDTQTPSLRHQYAACLRGRRSSSRGEEEGKGWENKASIVVSPAGPGQAAQPGASYVMWLARPTSLFRAAAHSNPYWGTSPSFEMETEWELWENQERRCENFSFSSAQNHTCPSFSAPLEHKIIIVLYMCMHK